MPKWEAPSTHNEGEPSADALAQAIARPYLDATSGRVKWWTSTDALPVGATPLYVVERASDGRRVFSTDSANERKAMLFGNNILLR